MIRDNKVKNNLTTKAVSRITGVNWNTVRKISHDEIKITLDERKKELKESGYKPRYLAVDEFALHKGHKYAICVMDIDTGEIQYFYFIF